MSQQENDGYYEVLWPRSPRQTGIQPLAKRLDTLNGKVIAQGFDRGCIKLLAKVLQVIQIAHATFLRSS